jgi:transcription elongation factor Elf1
MKTKSIDQLEQKLECIFCGAFVILKGRWHNGRAVCTECGQETDIKIYREQIESWQEKIYQYYNDKSR